MGIAVSWPELGALRLHYPYLDLLTDLVLKALVYLLDVSIGAIILASVEQDMSSFSQRQTGVVPL